MKFLGLVVLVALCSCTSRDKAAGSEGGPCYGNGSCNAGLVCASNLCVLMPGREAGRPDGAVADLGRPDRAAPDLRRPDLPRPDRAAPDMATCSSLNFAGAAKDAVPNSSAFNLGTTLSILVWIKIPFIGPPPAGGTTAWYLFDNGKSGVYCPPYGMQIDSTGHVRLGVRGGQGPLKCDQEMTAVSAGVVPTQRWVHVAAVWDNSEVRFYLDGQGETPHVVVPITPYQPIHDLWIGGDEGPHAAPGGGLSNAQLWSRALSTAEVQQAMTSSVANTAGLVGRWPLGEGAGTTAHDASGNGHDGNIQGATWQAGCPP